MERTTAAGKAGLDGYDELLLRIDHFVEMLANTGLETKNIRVKVSKQIFGAVGPARVNAGEGLVLPSHYRCVSY